MLKVYEYLDTAQDVTACDLLYAEYDEAKKDYENTAISQLTPQQITDLVENAILCADKESKEAAIKRLKRRIQSVLAEFEPHSAQMDFSPLDGHKTVHAFMAEVYDSVLDFASLLNDLCEDYNIGNTDIGKSNLRLTAWESAVCWYYEHGRFIMTNEEDIKQAINQHKKYLANPHIKVESYKRKSQAIKHKTDITGLSNDNKDNKSASLDRIIQFLKLHNLSTVEAEEDRKTYIEHIKANKSKK